jgi:hypothetical protein
VRTPTLYSVAATLQLVVLIPLLKRSASNFVDHCPLNIMYCKGIGLFYSTVFYSITTALTAKVSNVVTGAYVVEFTDDYVSLSHFKG